MGKTLADSSGIGLHEFLESGRDDQAAFRGLCVWIALGKSNGDIQIAVSTTCHAIDDVGHRRPGMALYGPRRRQCFFFFFLQDVPASGAGEDGVLEIMDVALTAKQ